MLGLGTCSIDHQLLSKMSVYQFLQHVVWANIVIIIQMSKVLGLTSTLVTIWSDFGFTTVCEESMPFSNVFEYLPSYQLLGDNNHIVITKEHTKGSISFFLCYLCHNYHFVNCTTLLITWLMGSAQESF